MAADDGEEDDAPLSEAEAAAAARRRIRDGDDFVPAPDADGAAAPALAVALAFMVVVDTREAVDEANYRLEGLRAGGAIEWSRGLAS